MKDTAIYIVAWTGGYEPPSFEAFNTMAEAEEQMKENERDMGDADQIDLLVILPGEVRPQVIKAGTVIKELI